MEKKNKTKSAFKKPSDLFRKNTKSRLALQKFLDNLQEQKSDNVSENKQITQCVFLGALCLKPVPDIFQVTLQPISFTTQSNTSVLCNNKTVNNNVSKRGRAVKIKDTNNLQVNKSPRKNSKNSSSIKTNVFYGNVHDQKPRNRILELFNNRNITPREKVADKTPLKVNLKLNGKPKSESKFQYRIKLGRILRKEQQDFKEKKETVSLKNKHLKKDQSCHKQKSVKVKESSKMKDDKQKPPKTAETKKCKSENKEMKIVLENTVPPLKIKINKKCKRETNDKNSAVDRAIARLKKNSGIEVKNLRYIESLPKQMSVMEIPCQNRVQCETPKELSRDSPVIIDLEVLPKKPVSTPNLIEQKFHGKMHKSEEPVHIIDIEDDDDDDEIEDYLEIDQSVVADLEALIPEEEIEYISNALINPKVQVSNVIPESVCGNANTKLTDPVIIIEPSENLNCDYEKSVIESGKSREIIEIDDIKQNVKTEKKLSDVVVINDNAVNECSVVEIKFDDIPQALIIKDEKNEPEPNVKSQSTNEIIPEDETSNQSKSSKRKSGDAAVILKKFKTVEKAQDGIVENKKDENEAQLLQKIEFKSSKLSRPKSKLQLSKSIRKITDFLSPGYDRTNHNDSDRKHQNINTSLETEKTKSITLKNPEDILHEKISFGDLVETRTLRSGTKQSPPGPDVAKTNKNDLPKLIPVKNVSKNQSNQVLALKTANTTDVKREEQFDEENANAEEFLPSRDAQNENSKIGCKTKNKSLSPKQQKKGINFEKLDNTEYEIIIPKDRIGSNTTVQVQENVQKEAPIPKILLKSINKELNKNISSENKELSQVETNTKKVTIKKMGNRFTKSNTNEDANITQIEIVNVTKTGKEEIPNIAKTRLRNETQKFPKEDQVNNIKKDNIKHKNTDIEIEKLSELDEDVGLEMKKNSKDQKGRNSKTQELATAEVDSKEKDEIKTEIQKINTNQEKLPVENEEFDTSEIKQQKILPRGRKELASDSKVKLRKTFENERNETDLDGELNEIELPQHHEKEILISEIENEKNKIKNQLDHETFASIPSLNENIIKNYTPTVISNSLGNSKTKYSKNKKNDKSPSSRITIVSRNKKVVKQKLISKTKGLVAKLKSKIKVHINKNKANLNEKIKEQSSPSSVVVPQDIISKNNIQDEKEVSGELSECKSENNLSSNLSPQIEIAEQLIETEIKTKDSVTNFSKNKRRSKVQREVLNSEVYDVDSKEVPPQKADVTVPNTISQEVNKQIILKEETLNTEINTSQCIMSETKNNDETKTEFEHPNEEIKHESQNALIENEIVEHNSSKIEKKGKELVKNISNNKRKLKVQNANIASKIQDSGVSSPGLCPTNGNVYVETNTRKKLRQNHKTSVHKLDEQEKLEQTTLPCLGKTISQSVTLEKESIDMEPNSELLKYNSANENNTEKDVSVVETEVKCSESLVSFPKNKRSKISSTSKTKIMDMGQEQSSSTRTAVLITKSKRNLQLKKNDTSKEKKLKEETNSQQEIQSNIGINISEGVSSETENDNDEIKKGKKEHNGKLSKSVPKIQRSSQVDIEITGQISTVETEIGSNESVRNTSKSRRKKKIQDESITSMVTVVDRQEEAGELSSTNTEETVSKSRKKRKLKNNEIDVAQKSNEHSNLKQQTLTDIGINVSQRRIIGTKKDKIDDGVQDDRNVLKDIIETSLPEGINENIVHSVKELQETKSKEANTKKESQDSINRKKVIVKKKKKHEKTEETKNEESEDVSPKKSSEEGNNNSISENRDPTSASAKDNLANSDYEQEIETRMKLEFYSELRSYEFSASEPYRRIYRCRVCLTVFGSYYKLKAHKPVHDVKNPYQCQECRKSYDDVEELAAHLRIHKGETFCEEEDINMQDEEIDIEEENLQEESVEEDIKPSNISRGNTKILKVNPTDDVSQSSSSPVRGKVLERRKKAETIQMKIAEIKRKLTSDIKKEVHSQQLGIRQKFTRSSVRKLEIKNEPPSDHLEDEQEIMEDEQEIMEDEEQTPDENDCAEEEENDCAFEEVNDCTVEEENAVEDEQMVEQADEMEERDPYVYEDEEEYVPPTTKSSPVQFQEFETDQVEIVELTRENGDTEIMEEMAQVEYLMEEKSSKSKSSGKRGRRRKNGTAASKKNAVRIIKVKRDNLPPLILQALNKKTFLLGKMPYPCKKCDSSFWTTAQLERHQLVHVLKKVPPPNNPNPKKVFKCEECGKDFKKICDLERHTRVHTGEKPSVCNICNKRFQQAYNLNKHLLIHTQEKNFECVICQKKFGRNDVLNRHVLTHSIDKPFHCSICSKTFIRSSQLNFHMRKHHGIKEGSKVPDKEAVDDQVAGKSTD